MGKGDGGNRDTDGMACSLFQCGTMLVKGAVLAAMLIGRIVIMIYNGKKKNGRNHICKAGSWVMYRHDNC